MQLDQPTLYDVLCKDTPADKLLLPAGLVLVLSGPKPHSSMKLDWQKITGSVDQLTVVQDFDSFMAVWLGYHKFHR